MHQLTSIRSVNAITHNSRIDLPEEPGVYAFWWIADRSKLLTANRRIVLKGPGERPVEVEYGEWWPHDLAYPCLYVGKTTNIRKRFALHIKRGSPGRLHEPHPQHHKAKPNTTSCQLRWGIEHIFPNDPAPLELIGHCVGFSYRTDFAENAIAERFFEEDRLVGTWRPWFNIDSER
ncbi:GIY-YIG nuclease family protein [Pseudomonas nitroreducens]|uniref:GIY-YIG nuclease family protein n=1 Tax=Pseudomonas TaxID=286 RepID=UPI002F3526E1